MKKRLFSFLAAVSVMTCVSPLCANANYRIVMTKQEYTDYTKLDFMSDDNRDVYIYTGDNPDFLFINGKIRYSRPAIFETKLSDRIYFNVNDETTNVSGTLDKIQLLLKDFVTENGDVFTAGWTKNNYSPEIELEYYIKPINNNGSSKPLEITPNDARKIKEILEKDDFAADLVYTTDVCVPNHGDVAVISYSFNTEGKTQEEKNAITAEIEAKIKAILEEKNLDVEVSVVPGHISLHPSDGIPFNDMLEVSEQLYANIDNITAMWAMDLSNSTSIGGIDLSNAVDGDSNCDEQMDMSDVVLIMQSLANPNKYQLSEQGRFNADMDGNGITVGDAQKIQMKLLGIE
ncbi:hypothetical protein [Ruminococcus flavefaciens]|uniref:hypothetical protein n=1 Tax=Ruminococcus flavefaciens TaxID=1265 RepID=UPI0026EB14B9|nr:hypothetical protein [Ruminococcus flavefaciens]